MMLRCIWRRLGFSGAKTANELCTCVFDGNMPLLRRFLEAGVPVDAGDYVSAAATFYIIGLRVNKPSNVILETQNVKPWTQE